MYCVGWWNNVYGARSSDWQFFGAIVLSSGNKEMGERIAALAALSRIRAIADQIPVQASSPAVAAETVPVQTANVIEVTRPLQEIAGLRQAAETTSQRITPDTNGQRADAVGAAMSQEAESAITAPNAASPQQATADVAGANTRNRLSFNRAIFETLRGGAGTARPGVPSIEEQRTAIRRALTSRRSQAPTQRAATTEQTGSVSRDTLSARYNPEADALAVLAQAPAARLSYPRQAAYSSSAPETVTSGGSRLNFLA